MFRLLFVCVGLLAATGAPWHEHYRRGLELIELGDGRGATVELEAALADKPEPGLRMRTYGMTYVDYLPHLYLAVATHMSGDAEAARRHLEAAEAAGAAAQSEAGRSVLDAYRLLLGERTAPPTVTPARPSPADSSIPGYLRYERDEEILSDAEFDAVKTRVLSRCQLAPSTRLQEAPWYFHYELGLELSERDPQRALDAFIEAAERRPESRRQARIYGMWFKDYLPYFQIARTHAALGHWQCVDDALSVSRKMSEVSREDEEFFELEQLLEESRAQQRK